MKWGRPYDPFERVIYLDAVLEGPTGKYDLLLVLDTGTPRTIIEPEVAGAVGLDQSRSLGPTAVPGVGPGAGSGHGSPVETLENRIRLHAGALAAEATGDGGEGELGRGHLRGPVGGVYHACGMGETSLIRCARALARAPAFFLLLLLLTVATGFDREALCTLYCLLGPDGRGCCAPPTRHDPLDPCCRVVDHDGGVAVLASTPHALGPPPAAIAHPEAAPTGIPHHGRVSAEPRSASDRAQPPPICTAPLRI